ncbi:amidase family protein [Acinetobacter sp. YH1901134]|uniref:amidase family protein n=1 Tax=Acinetobacter sp. YH1901134 TaxID=2601199 RepID=UPI0015D30134|nr:amidase family protein [Acinetobacter sp. YH1901134]
MNIVEKNIQLGSGKLTVMVKDSIDIQGIKTISGSRALEDTTPAARNADMVEYILNADCTITAQTLETSFSTASKFAWLNVQANSEVIECIQDYLSQANLQVEQVEVETFKKAFDAGMQIINYENWQAYGELTKTGLIGADVQGRLLKTAETTLEQVQQAEQVKAEFTQEIDALLNKFDALLLPTLPQIPPKVADAENTVAFLNLTNLVRPFNLSGHPAISIPLETKQGLPVGLQIVTKRNADEQLCVIAKFVVKAAQ